MYPNKQGSHPEMEHFGQPGPGREHFGLPDSEMKRSGPPLPQGDGSTGLPSLLDIKVSRPPGGNTKRGAEQMDGSFHGGEHPPLEKMPSNYGSGNDMWLEENPIPPPRGPGRGAPAFRRGPGRGAPRGRGMRRVRGR